MSKQYKQVIIVRKDLNMSHGKMAAQVAHASMAFLSWFIRDNADQDGHIDAWFDHDILDNWLNGAFTKVILQAKNKTQLEKAITLANEMGFKEGEDFFLIKDNCYTELKPEEIDENGIERTLTCIGFKPMDPEVIDRIAKKYHLYIG